jgi:hypothetical protein
MVHQERANATSTLLGGKSSQCRVVHFHTLFGRPAELEKQGGGWAFKNTTTTSSEEARSPKFSQVETGVNFTFGCPHPDGSSDGLSPPEEETPQTPPWDVSQVSASIPAEERMPRTDLTAGSRTNTLFSRATNLLSRLSSVFTYPRFSTRMSLGNFLTTKLLFHPLENARTVFGSLAKWAEGRSSSQHTEAATPECGEPRTPVTITRESGTSGIEFGGRGNVPGRGVV